MNELYWKPAHELAAMIRKRELKPSELMDVTIRRIEQTNPKLNAFCALRADDAMAEARALDEKIARREEVGTLAGLPLGVKDLEDTVGLRHHVRLEAVQGQHAEVRFDPGRAAEGGRRDRDRQDQRARVRLHRLHQEPAVRRHAQSVESRAHARRIVGRHFGGNRGRRGADFDRLGWRRLGANPGLLHRMLRAEADLRQDSERPDARDATMERHLACTARSRAPCATPRCSWTRSSAITRPIPTRCRIREFPTRRFWSASPKNSASRFIPTSASSCSATWRAKSQRLPPCSRTSATT